MKHFYKQFSFLLCLILIFSLFTPLQASANAIIQYNYFNTPYQATVTADQQLLITERSHSNTAQGVVYRSDISKVAANGVQNRITVDSGRTEFINYQNKDYVIHYDTSTTQLSIYNQHLQLLDTKTLNLPAGHESRTSFEVKQYDQYISIIVITDDSPERGVAVYNLNTKTIETNLKLPTTQIIPLRYETEKFLLVDALGQVNKTVDLTGIFDFTESIYLPSPTDFVDGIAPLIVTETNDAYTNSIHHIFSIDVNGQVIDKKTISPSKLSYVDVIQFDHFLYLYTEIYENNEITETSVYTYDISSFNFNKTNTYNNWVYPYKVNASIFIEHHLDEGSHYEDHIKKANGQTINIVYSHSTEYFGDYYVITDYFNKTSTFYDLYTGKRIKELPYNLNVRYVDDNFAYATSYDSTVKKYIGHLIPFKEVPTIPSGPVYDKNKTWTVTLSDTIDQQSINSSDIFVTDASGQKVAVKMNAVDNQLFIYAPISGYQSGQTYTLYVNNLTSQSGVALKEKKSKVFTIQ